MASIVSFGFVFVHPFMDGSGRLSRFLFHQVLCQRGALQNGLVLPVSIVLRQNESEYLDALQAFSEPARQYWDVTYIDENQFRNNSYPNYPSTLRGSERGRAAGFNSLPKIRAFKSSCF